MRTDPSQSKRRIPDYVGITGVQDSSHVEMLTSLARQNGFDAHSDHVLMLGCLVSPNTYRNGAPCNTLRPERHIRGFSQLVDILTLSESHGALGMLHFELSKSWPGTAGDARHVLDLLGALAQHNLRPPVQLNGVLLPDELARIHHEGKVSIVLQLRKELSQRGEDELAQYLSSIREYVAAILIDPSAGTGEAIDLSSLQSLVALISTQMLPGCRLGFAGGFGSSTPAQVEHTLASIRSLRSLLHSSAFSVDAETHLREAHPPPGVDTLSISRCQGYLETVRKGLRE
jgi:hypothetical protein